MSGSSKRERQLARERYQRQQAKRAEAAARRRQWQQVTAVVLAVVLVLGGVVWLAAALGGDDSSVAAAPTHSPSQTTSAPSPTAPGAGCTYTKTPGKAAKDVGVPTYDKKTATTPYTATVKTNRGDVVIEMASAKAPCTANSFRHLATKGFYDGSSCHRLTTSGLFVLQCGDPTGSGTGGPGYQFGVENAPADEQYPAGTVAMARTADPNSNGSQFFLVYKDTQLPGDTGGYSIFGTVTKGLDVVKRVAAAGVEGSGGDGRPKQPVTIESVMIGTA